MTYIQLFPDSVVRSVTHAIGRPIPIAITVAVIEKITVFQITSKKIGSSKISP